MKQYRCTAPSWHTRFTVATEGHKGHDSSGTGGVKMIRILRHIWFLGLLTLLGTAWACSDSSEACEKACSKHVSLVSQNADQTLQWWERLAEPLLSSARDSERRWRDDFDRRKEEFLDTCTTTCNDGARTAMVECRRRAMSIGEWTRCAGK